MTFKAVLAGFLSLKPMAPGLVFLAAAVFLVLLPRGWSAALGSGVGIAAVFLAVICFVLTRGASSQVLSDFEVDPFAELAFWWIAILLPACLACLQRTSSRNRGSAIAGLMLAVGSLSFAAAAKTVSLLLAALAGAVIGATLVPACSISKNSLNAMPHARIAGRVALATLLLWCVLAVGVGLALWAESGWSLTNQIPADHPAGVVGAAAAATALFGFLGLAPFGGWMTGGGVGAAAAAAAMYRIIGAVGLCKLYPLVFQPKIAPMLWAWALGSLVVQLIGALSTNSLIRTATFVQGAMVSTAVGSLAIHDRSDPSSICGAFTLLMFVTLSGPGLASAVEACQLTGRGTLGKPDGVRSFALNANLWLISGLPLSVGFWGLVSLLTATGIAQSFAGMHQVLALATVGVLVVLGLMLLMRRRALDDQPPIQPMEDDCRWLVAGAIYVAVVSIALGCRPALVFDRLQESMSAATEEITVPVLKPQRVSP